MNLFSKITKNNKLLDTFFIMLLLCIFAFGSLLIVMFSINAYQSISEKMDNNFIQSTPLSYVASKVRQFDFANSLRLENKEDTTALVIKNVTDTEVCETWIYNFEGCIYETYIEQGTEFSLSDGTAIFENAKIEFSMENDNLLSVRTYDSKNNPMNLSLSVRSQTERGVENE